LEHEVKFENGTKEKRKLCSEVIGPEKYKNYLPIGGWVKTVYSKQQQQQSRVNTMIRGTMLEISVTS
jgi:hypothetical protein